MCFSLPPREAVIAAYAYSNRDCHHWDFEKKYGHLVKKTKLTVRCGDFSAVRRGTLKGLKAPRNK